MPRPSKPESERLERMSVRLTLADIGYVRSMPDSYIRDLIARDRGLRPAEISNRPAETPHVSESVLRKPRESTPKRVNVTRKPNKSTESVIVLPKREPLAIVSVLPNQEPVIAAIPTDPRLHGFAGMNPFESGISDKLRKLRHDLYSIWCRNRNIPPAPLPDPRKGESVDRVPADLPTVLDD